MSSALDLKWSKKLKEAGIRGKSEFKRIDFGTQDTALLKTAYPIMYNEFPAYTLEELLNMVKGDIKGLEWYEDRWCFSYEGKASPMTCSIDIDPKIAVAEAILWQKGRE